MIYVAKITDGFVSSVVVQPDDYVPSENEALIGPENTVGIGCAFDGAAFIPPAVNEGDGDEL
jgi:hypothetical protein